MLKLKSLQQVIPKRGKSFNLTSEAEKVALWKIIDRKRERWIIGVNRAVKVRFKEELKMILRSAANAIEPQVLMTTMIDDIGSQENKKAWVKLLRNIYLPVGKDLADRVISDLSKSEAKGADPRQELLIEAAILNFLEQTEEFKADLITETTRKEIVAVLEAGILAGESVDQLSLRVEAFFNKTIIPNRAALISRTEVIQASNLGSIEGARATGIQGLKKTWLATRDLRTRSPHLAEDGASVELEAAFVLSTGDRLMFPADGSLGASAGQLLNCRCTIFFEGE